MLYSKEDLINKIADREDVSKVEAKKYIEGFLGGVEAIVADMQPKDKLQLTGYLGFEVKHRGAYIGVNPRTKDEVEVPAKNSLKVKGGAILSKAVVK